MIEVESHPSPESGTGGGEGGGIGKGKGPGINCERDCGGGEVSNVNYFSRLTTIIIPDLGHKIINILLIYLDY